ncbi:cation:proton antiporter [Enterococcus sp. ALS3]|uniref:Cation:proton antiporter n=1 Tax=Enterococcus alishanensis TaxID=1303817 RepID=A0ABS6TBZ4_9ENTE|nr:cation:proton antiporter [Enterococcus alishanensis]MBV7390425.1 cation:proton antiporter [Enterococcus alishanensis]
MLISIAIVILLGLILGSFAKKVHLPPLVGFLCTGILLGPFALDLLSSDLLSISTDLREIALIIILTRAGLSLDLKDLIKVGRPAILMCFLPALIEIIGTVILAPLFLNFSIAESLLLGSIIAAVSPAVIVPRMLKLMEEGLGKNKKIPQILLAGSSVDDVFVLVLFASFLGINQGDKFTVSLLGQIPVAIILGFLGGVLTGIIIVQLFKKMAIRDSLKVLIIMSVSFLLMGVEDQLEGILSFSGMLSVISLSLTIFQFQPPIAQKLAIKFNKLWLAAEIFLFVLVGASVNITFALKAGILPILFILLVTLIRMVGVLLALLKTNLNSKEKLFCMIAYTPKATVQAAIVGIPFALGISNGEMMLTVAVLSILITAPIGAYLIDLSYQKLLTE